MKDYESSSRSGIRVAMDTPNKLNRENNRNIKFYYVVIFVRFLFCSIICLGDCRCIMACSLIGS